MLFSVARKCRFDYFFWSIQRPSPIVYKVFPGSSGLSVHTTLHSALPGQLREKSVLFRRMVWASVKPDEQTIAGRHYLPQKMVAVLLSTEVIKVNFQVFCQVQVMRLTPHCTGVGLPAFIVDLYRVLKKPLPVYFKSHCIVSCSCPIRHDINSQ